MQEWSGSEAVCRGSDCDACGSNEYAKQLEIILGAGRGGGASLPIRIVDYVCETPDGDGPVKGSDTKKK